MDHGVAWYGCRLIWCGVVRSDGLYRGSCRQEVLKGKTGPGWNECGAEVGSLVY